MEDFCAVCAEPLEWIAYGPCGHREVCSTCTARLRVVLDDKRCCICKQDCPFVFVTKALGDYTKVITDFDSLHQNGEVWFESDIGAFFDDEDEYKRIKAMCRLQCKICEAAGSDNLPNGAVRKGHVFKNLDALRRHIFAAHRLIMCSLCLEGRKVFIQDQKLYTKAQLDRHSSRGDSKVDEEERGGFTGHPMCAFCTKRFYGENELYHHMSTEHFTCHLCQRSRPGQFEYYENYDDLEAHFRNEHVLCEHPDCLAKKFIVFLTEGELKVHNAKEHGGSLTRAQRNAALKIPVSYQFRRTGQQSDYRGSSYYRGSRENDLNAELLSTATRENLDQFTSEDADTSGTGTSVTTDPEQFPALAQSLHAPRDSMESTRWYASALHGSSQSSLNDCAFPPLPGASQPQQVRQQNQRPLASLFGATKGRGKVKVLNASDKRQQAGPSESRPPKSRANGILNPTEYPELLGARAGHSISAVSGRGPPLGAGGGSHSSSSSVSAVSGPSSSSSAGVVRHADAGVGQLSMEEIRAATKVLIEQIRAQLKGNAEQFANFKEVHAQFRKGGLSAKTYYDQVAKLGLSDIIPELVRLCPDQQKQQELQDVMRESTTSESKGAKDQVKTPAKAKNGFTEKEPEVEVLSTDGYRSSRRSGSASSLSATAPNASGPSVLFKAEVQPAVPSQPSSSAAGANWACETCTLLNPLRNTVCAACNRRRPALSVLNTLDDTTSTVSKPTTDDAKKKKKKVPKFIRSRIGEAQDDPDSAAAEPPPPQPPDMVARGAWRNGGGQRLRAMTSTSSSAPSAWNKAG